MKTNLNIQVSFVETDHGREVFDKHFKDMNLDPSERREGLFLRNGRMRMPLWEAMNIYGPEMYMGCQIPFVDNEIDIEHR